MKKLFLLIAIFAITITFSSKMLSEEAETPVAVSLSMYQDPSFGFYPYVFGSIGIGTNTDFTFYGTFWTQDLLGGSKGGLNLLTEFGFGLAFKMLDGALVLNPAIGIAHGTFQSGGGDRPLIGDNIVPQIAISYTSGDLGFTGGGIYWKGLRRESRNTPFIDLIEYYVQADYGFSKYIRTGIYYDHLMQRLIDKPIYSPTVPNEVIDYETVSYTSYLWVGPMMKFNVKNTTFMFAFGADLVDYLDSSKNDDERQIKDFYKMGFTINF